MTAPMVCVTAIDTFMSGWGHAQGRRNKLVILCDMDTIDWVENYARSRPEMKFVKQCNVPKRYLPKIAKGVTEFYEADHLVQFKTRDEMPAWFPEVKAETA